MADATKAPTALANVIVTRYFCCSLGYVRTGVRACVVYLCGEAVLSSFEDNFLQHRLGPQDSDRVRDPVRRFGHCGSDRALGRVLRVLTYVLVC